MIENQVWHTLFCQDVNMEVQKYFTHTFDSLFITYLNLEAFKIWSIVTVFLLRLYLRILTFLLFQCRTTTVIGEKTHFLSTFFHQDDIQIEPHILIFNAIESFAKMYLARPSWSKILRCFKSSCGIFSHFTYLELKRKALTCIQYNNLARNN